MKKLLVLILMAALIFISVPAFADVHNKAGGKIEVRNLEVLVEKVTPINFPKWFAIDAEVGKTVVQDIGYDKFRYVEDDYGVVGWISFVFDLNTNK